MWFLNFTLLNKKNLTPDVFEMVFEIDKEIDLIPGQFITFLLPKTGFWRAYSVLDKKQNKLFFIVKRLENWRGWSREVCDLEIWWVFRWVGPTGHFIDSWEEKNKLFLSTWTWIVPEFFIIKNLLENWFNKKIKLIFWNRSKKDLYYISELNNLKTNYPNFENEIFLSQENISNYNFWRITDFLQKNNLSNFEEFYICGNPNMVNESINKLKNIWYKDNIIFREKY